MITSFRVRNYKALRCVDLQLTPVHVLIGPNDSGKTSILSALRAFSRSMDVDLAEAFGPTWSGRELVWHGDPNGAIGFAADAVVNDSIPLTYELCCRFANEGRGVWVESEEATVGSKKVSLEARNEGRTRVKGVAINNERHNAAIMEAGPLIHDAFSGVEYYHWNPRTLALPVAADSTRRFRLNPDGFGLAMLLDDILGVDRTRFSELEARFSSIFPEIASIRLVRQRAYKADGERFSVSRLREGDGKGIEFELRSSKNYKVSASEVSDGVMLVLAYLALLYSPEPPRLLLIEEPENGIHPKRLREVLNIVRSSAGEQTHTQIVLTTHSPYAVDLFAPQEVTLCTKEADGSVTTTRLDTSDAVQKQGSVFSLGEIWSAEGDEDIAKRSARTAT